MQFRDSVLAILDEKYLDMLDGNTPPPISQVSIEDSSQYENNRNGLLGRLANEAQDFLKAAATVRQLVDSRTERDRQEWLLEYREKSQFKPCLVIGICALVFLVASTIGICLFDGMDWLTDVFVPNTSFETFWAFFEGPEEPGFWTGAVCAGIVAIIAILMIVCVVIAEFGSEGDGSSSVVAVILILAVPLALLLRLIVAIFGFAAPILASPIGMALIGIISIVSILIAGRDLMSRKYLNIKRIFVISLIIVSAVCVLLENIYLDNFFGKMIEYYFG